MLITVPHRKPRKKKPTKFFYRLIFYSELYMDGEKKWYIKESFHGIRRRVFDCRDQLEMYYRVKHPKKLENTFAENGRKLRNFCAKKAFTNAQQIKTTFTKEETEAMGLLCDFDYQHISDIKEKTRREAAEDRILKLTYNRLF